MATTKLNQIRADYNSKLSAYKQEYAERQGTLKGFDSSPERKRWNRNKKQAERRYKVKREVQQAQKSYTKNPQKVQKNYSKSTQKNTFSNIVVIEPGKPFFLVFSYGSEMDKAAVAAFKLYKSIGIQFIAIVDDTVLSAYGFNGSATAEKGLYDFRMRIRQSYKECSKAQHVAKLGSAALFVTVLSGDKNGSKYLLVKVYSPQ